MGRPGFIKKTVEEAFQVRFTMRKSEGGTLELTE